MTSNDVIDAVPGSSGENTMNVEEIQHQHESIFMVHVISTSIEKHDDALTYISKIMKDKDVIINKEARNLMSKTFREKVI